MNACWERRLVGLVVPVLLLVGCQKAAPPVSETIQATAIPVSAYPPPGEPVLPGSLLTSPAASTSALSGGGTAYPGVTGANATHTPPPHVQATSTPSGAYPPPGGLQPTLTSGLFSPYPPPGNEGTSTSTPAPPTERFESTPTNAPTSQNEMTPTLTPTLALVGTTLQATDPQTVKLAVGKTQLIEFFAYWSPVSKAMVPVMDRLQRLYGDRVGFVFLDVDDPANHLFKVLLGDRLPPVFFLLDGEGRVIKEWRGYVSAEEFEAQFALAGVQ